MQGRGSPSSRDVPCLPPRKRRRPNSIHTPPTPLPACQVGLLEAGLPQKPAFGNLDPSSRSFDVLRASNPPPILLQSSIPMRALLPSLRGGRRSLFCYTVPPTSDSTCRPCHPSLPCDVEPTEGSKTKREQNEYIFHLFALLPCENPLPLR